MPQAHSALAAFYRWLLWGNVLMALSAAGWVVVATRHLGLPDDPVLIVLAFALAVAFYTRDRLEDNERAADSFNFPERTIWIEQHAKGLRRWLWAGVGAALLCIAARPASLLPLLAGVGFALTYTVRWLPWDGKRYSWKQLPLMKMPYVAVLWTILTVLTPATVYDAWQRTDTWLLAGVVCLLIAGQILVNDLRDVEGDARHGTYSLPVVVGERGARIAGAALMAGAAALSLPAGGGALPLTALYSAIFLLGYRRVQEGWWRPWIEAQGGIAGLLSVGLM